MAFRRNRESGLSIVEVLVCLAVLTPAFVLLEKNYLLNKRLQTDNSINYERELIKMMVIKMVACEESQPASACPLTGFADLNKITQDGLVENFISKTGAGRKYGSWTLRAECSPSNDGFVIRAARLNPSGTLLSTQDADFIPDPVSKKVETWSHPNTLLYGDGITLCGGYVGAFPPPDVISEWLSPPFVFNHKLNTDKLKIHFEMKATSPTYPLLDQYAFSSGYLVASRTPRVLIENITPTSVRVRIAENLGSSVSSPNFGTLSAITKVKVSIWKIN